MSELIKICEANPIEVNFVRLGRFIMKHPMAIYKVNSKELKLLKKWKIA